MKRLLTRKTPAFIVDDAVIETVSFGEIDGRKVRVIIHDYTDLKIEICCHEGERDVLRFSVEQWHALERRVLEGLQAVTA